MILRNGDLAARMSGDMYMSWCFTCQCLVGRVGGCGAFACVLLALVIGEQSLFACHVSEVWNDVSEEAIDLLRQLLKPDPTHRLTAQQALAHDWFADCSPLPEATDVTCDDML